MSTNLTLLAVSALAGLGLARRRGGSAARSRREPEITVLGAEPQDQESARGKVLSLYRYMTMGGSDLARQVLSIKPDALEHFLEEWRDGPHPMFSPLSRLSRFELPAALPRWLQVLEEAEEESDYPHEAVDQFLESVDPGVIEVFNDWARGLSWDDEMPPSFSFSHPKILKGAWLIHHSPAYGLESKGFRLGVAGFDDLAYTGGAKTFSGQRPGWSFGFPPGSHEHDGFDRGRPAYGEYIYAVWVPYAILAHHYGDQGDQVIFWGPSASRIVEIKKGDVRVGPGRYDIEERWFIPGYDDKDGRTISAADSSDLVDWLDQNWSQYSRKLIGGQGLARARRRVERGWSDEVVGTRQVKDYYGETREVPVRGHVYRGPFKGGRR